jgi:hypothetical protein
MTTIDSSTLPPSSQVLSSSGWVKSWRKSEESDIWTLPPLAFRIWTWLLWHVTREARTVYGVGLQPGEILTSYANIAEGVRWKEDGTWKSPTIGAVRWSVGRLVKYGSLQQGPRQHGLWLKIQNWSEYQSAENGSNNRGHDRTTTGLQQDYNIIQEVRSKNEEERVVASESPPASRKKVARGKPPNPRVQPLVAVWIDAMTEAGLSAPTGAERGRLGVLVKEQIAETSDDGVIEAAIRRIVEEAKSPHLLPRIVNDVERAGGAGGPNDHLAAVRWIRALLKGSGENAAHAACLGDEQLWLEALNG